MGKLDGYKVLVTGSTSGIGLGITKKFISEGATVVGLGRDFHRTTELGEQYIPCKCDMYDPAQIKAAFEFASEQFDGRLDVLVNCAGRGTYGAIDNFEPEEFDENFYLLVRAYMLTTRYAIPLLKQSPVANIVNIASASGHVLDVGQFMYSLSKTSIIKFTKLTAKTNPWLRANSISPGIIKTPIFNYCNEEMKKAFDLENDFAAFAQMFPCKRVGEPEDIARVALLFASKDGEYINGTDILVDGGMVAYLQ
ncbi:MAG: SDR family oxidoreductase [Mogibacterium sp.]|nr:SDR family oxidoreductase [Mogibacterium sp.]